jgi:hypothetical protein
MVGFFTDDPSGFANRSKLNVTLGCEMVSDVVESWVHFRADHFRFMVAENGSQYGWMTTPLHLA